MYPLGRKHGCGQPTEVTRPVAPTFPCVLYRGRTSLVCQMTGPRSIPSFVLPGRRSRKTRTRQRDTTKKSERVTREHRGTPPRIGTNIGMWLVVKIIFNGIRELLACSRLSCLPELTPKGRPITVVTGEILQRRQGQYVYTTFFFRE